MELNIDLTSVQEEKTVPDGIYLLRVNDVEKATSQAGKPMLNLELAIVAPKEQKDEVGVVTHFLSLSDNRFTRSRLKQFVKALGLEIGPKINLNEWKGKTIAGICAIEETPEYGMRNRWNMFMPATGIEAKANKTQEETDELARQAAMRSGSGGGGTGSGGGKDGQDDAGVW